MAAHTPADGWIGAGPLRKEDERFLNGAGMYVADIRMPGVQDIAFVRSQMAHALKLAPMLRNASRSSPPGSKSALVWVRRDNAYDASGSRHNLHLA
jgi:hypothetical protein